MTKNFVAMKKCRKYIGKCILFSVYRSKSFEIFQNNEHFQFILYLVKINTILNFIIKKD